MDDAPEMVARIDVSNSGYCHADGKKVGYAGGGFLIITASEASAIAEPAGSGSTRTVPRRALPVQSPGPQKPLRSGVSHSVRPFVTARSAALSQS